MKSLTIFLSILLFSITLAAQKQDSLTGVLKSTLLIGSIPGESVVEIASLGFKQNKSNHDLVIKDLQPDNYLIRVTAGKKYLEYYCLLRPGTEERLLFNLKKKETSILFIAEAGHRIPFIIQQDTSAVELVDVVEESPSYPGGEEARVWFVQEHLIYPEKARSMGLQGKVFMTFTVETDGRLTDIRVLRGLGGGCDEEAIRLIQQMPKWKPALQRGKPVRAQFNLPLKFNP